MGMLASLQETVAGPVFTLNSLEYCHSWGDFFIFVFLFFMHGP